MMLVLRCVECGFRVKSDSGLTVWVLYDGPGVDFIDGRQGVKNPTNQRHANVSRHPTAAHATQAQSLPRITMRHRALYSCDKFPSTSENQDDDVALHCSAFHVSARCFWKITPSLDATLTAAGTRSPGICALQRLPNKRSEQQLWTLAMFLGAEEAMSAKVIRTCRGKHEVQHTEHNAPDGLHHRPEPCAPYPT